jgi:hypothetical protein
MEPTAAPAIRASIAALREKSSRRGSYERRWASPMHARSKEMPFTYVIDREAKLVSVTVSGEVTPEEALDTFNEIVSHPDFCPGMNVLSDHRQMQTIMPTRFVGTLISRIRSVREQLAGAKWAMVETSPAGYGMARMASGLAGFLDVDIQVFRTVEEARIWLVGSGARATPN